MSFLDVGNYIFPAQGFLPAQGFFPAHGLAPAQGLLPAHDFSIFAAHGLAPAHPAYAGKLAAAAVTIAVIAAVLANLLSNESTFDVFVMIISLVNNFLVSNLMDRIVIAI